MLLEAADLLLKQIAKDLSSENVVFPTCFDLTLRIRSVLKDPDVSVDQLAKVVGAEPLLSARILNVANSVAARGGGSKISGIKQAIMRIGMERVRSVSFALAMEQLARSRHMVPFQDLSRNIMEHSMVAAGASRCLARRYPCGVAPDHALFAGLVHDLGAFYVLFRAAEDPVLAREQSQIVTLMENWHDNIGTLLLSAMNTAEDVVAAVEAHESDQEVGEIASLREILIIADRFAHQVSSWRTEAYRLERQAMLDRQFDAETQQAILAEAKTELADLQASLG